MQLPFTAEAFFGVFRDYNEAMWPAQPILLGLAVAATVLVFLPGRSTGMVISAILAFLWAWLALAYHLAFFTGINPLAYAFAGISLAGALVFVWQGLIRRRLHFGRVRGARAFIGVALISFALLVYPLWSWHAGHPYPFMPTFGLPCPTTIFTIGVLAFLKRPHPRSPFVVPVLWCLVGAQAAFLLDVTQDLALIVAAVAGLALAVYARDPAGLQWH